MKRSSLYFLLCMVLCYACTRTDSSESVGIANLTVQVPEVAYDDYSDKMASTPSISTEDVKVIDWDETTELVVGTKVSRPLQKIASISDRNIAPPLKNTLQKGASYRLVVLDSKNKFILSQDYVVGESNPKAINLPTTEKYNFIAYSLGTQERLRDLNLQKGSSVDNETLAIEESKDVMVGSQKAVQLKIGDNSLKLELKHLFSRVKVEVNTNDVGKIDKIGNFFITNIYKQSRFSYNASVYQAVDVTFENLIESQVFGSTKISADAYMAYGLSNSLLLDGLHTNRIILDKISISGKEKNNVVLYEWTGKSGVYYTIQLNFRKKAPTGFNDGNVIWATGNLIKTIDGKYTFAASQGDFGDYWYRDTDGQVYENPMNLSDKTNNLGRKIPNICALVGEGWRLPTQQDILHLQSLAKWYENPSNKYFGEYTSSTTDKVIGVYFGIGTKPNSSEQDNYLFLPAAGAYNSKYPQSVGVECYYWHTGLGVREEGTSFQMASGYMSAKNNGGLDKQRSNSLRCVRDAK